MKLVIIGNGVAGTTTARMVASADPSIDIAIYSVENHAYYPRPRLVDFVAGRVAANDLPQYDAAWYAARGLRLHLGRTVANIDAENRRVLVADGETVPYDQLVLATGAHGWVPPIEGSDQPHVFTLRTLDDALAIRERIAHSENVTVLGGGLLGLDTASALCQHSPHVTVVEMAPWLLPRQLDREGADMLTERIAQMGIQVITGDVCSRIAERQVTLKSGRTLSTDMVIISAGVRANIGLAQQAGLTCGRGVMIDSRLRTSDPDILAVGDVAEFNGRVWGIIPAALAQARVAADQITGGDALYQDIVPSTTLKVSGIDLTSMGDVCPEDDDCHEFRHADYVKGIYKKIVVRDGQVVGAILLGDRQEVATVNRLVNQDVDVWEHRALLNETGMDLKALYAAATG